MWRTNWFVRTGIEAADRELDDATTEVAWSLATDEAVKQREIVARVHGIARQRGLERRGFLASIAGIATTLAVTNRLARKNARRPTTSSASGGGGADACLDAKSTAPPGAGFRASFTRADQATDAEWRWIGMATIAQQPAVAETLLAMLTSTKGFNVGFKVDQLTHMTQAATRAKNANASDELVLCALCHDIGKVISIEGHPEIAAALLRPYVSDGVYQIVRTHQDFQGKWYYNYLGRPTNLRDQYVALPWYNQAVTFTDEWDQISFDPTFKTQPLDYFEPLVRQMFAKPTFRPPTVCT
jgi:predicted HD phosphohydrolase